MIPLYAKLLIGAIVAVPTVVFLLAEFRRPHIDKVFPGLLTKGYGRRPRVGVEGVVAENELVEELSLLGKVLTSRTTWASTALLQILVISGIVLFYVSAVMIVWRIRRNIVNSGVTHSVDVSISDGDATLEGPVSTEDLYVEASRKAAEIIGSGHVINRLRVEHPEILGESTDQIGEAQITIDTLYDDSPDSIRQIEAVVHLPVFETVTLKRGVSFQQFIASRYGIDISKLPNSYRVVGHRIADLNNPNLPALTPGSLRMPILPARFGAQGNRLSEHSRNRPPSIIGFEAHDRLGPLLQVDVSFRPHLALSSTVILQFPFTRGNAVQTQGSAQLLQSSMTIQFASSGPSNSGHMSLADADDRKAVVDALKRQARRPATIFILDSGWPDELSYRSSIVQLRKLVDTAANYYNLDKIPWEAESYVPLAKDEKSQHCVYIQNSLKEFTDLDPSGIVNVVYVPLDTQQNAKQILYEMIRLYRIQTVMHRDTQIADDTKTRAAEFASETLKSIVAGEPFDLDKVTPTPSVSKYRQRWMTNSAIVAAVWYLAELAAEQDAHYPVFFLNESWTVIPDTVDLGAPGVSSGILVAAAGNTPNKEVNTDTGKIDFAQQATPAKNVLAALDTKPGLNSPFCDSSQLDKSTLDNTMAAAYDGEVVDGGLCGTSFSAPRIAWLLALREATRTEELQQRQWAEKLQDRLRAIRNQSSSMFERLYLHPKNLLQ